MAASIQRSLRRCVSATNARCSRNLLGHRSHRVRHVSNQERHLVLGIETSCDDTGAAVISRDGELLSHALHSQTRLSVQLGGVIPPIARDQHEEHIAPVVTAALQDAGIAPHDLCAIAVTVKPGLPLSLLVGLKYAKAMATEAKKPLIPIHHMEAHALTVRFSHPVKFPYLVMLVSGGHTQLALARDVDSYLLLGTAIDNAIGDAFDKVGRRLRLRNLPEVSGLSYGAAMEKVARKGDPERFEFPQIMPNIADCNFSFAGLINRARMVTEAEEKRLGCQGSDVLSTLSDVCASYQHAVLRHLARRLNRAIVFCDARQLVSRDQDRVMVMSGGVASNSYLREGLRRVCEHHDYSLVCPPPDLCTDNGLMIAWNGVEKLRQGRGAVHDIGSVDIQPKCPLGEDWTAEVLKHKLKLPRIKLL